MVGERWSPRAHELRDLLTRNGVPHVFHAADSQEGRRLLERGGPRGRARAGGDPARRRACSSTPTNAELADAYGVSTTPRTTERDFDVVGRRRRAGRAGGGGLRLVGGPRDAGRRARVDRRPGGLQLADPQLPRLRARASAAPSSPSAPTSRRGSSARTSCSCARSPALRARRRPARADARPTAREASARRGRAGHRRLLPPARRSRARGADRARASSTAPRCRRRRRCAGQDVFVVGGGNSAGQAALHLAPLRAPGDDRCARRRRSPTSMSQLPDRPDRRGRQRRRAALTRGRRTVAASGRLESLSCATAHRSRARTVPAAALFILIGAAPHTAWLPRRRSSATTGATCSPARTCPRAAGRWSGRR